MALDLAVSGTGFGLFASELVADGDGEGAGVEVLHAEAHGGFVEVSLCADRPEPSGAVFGREDVGVAEGFLHVGLGDVVAGGVFGLGSAEPVVHAVAPDGVEEFAHLLMIEGEELLHGGDAFGVEAGFGAGAYAGEIAEFKMRDGAWKLRGQKANEAVGFLHVAGDLGEVAVGRHADGATESDSDVLVNGLLDLEGDLAGAGRLLLAAHKLADHLVDGGVVRDGAGEVDGLGDGVGVPKRPGVAAFDEDDAGAEFFGFADLRASLDAEGFGLVAGSDADGGVGHGGDDGERFAGVVLLVKLLFYGRKKAVEVDVEEGEAVGMGWGGHGFK